MREQAGSCDGGSDGGDEDAEVDKDGRRGEDGGGRARVVDGGVTATGVLSRERGNLITISSTL